MTRTELLEKMRVERARLMDLVGDLSPEVAGRPGAAGEWSIKDVIAHMLFWEEDAVRRIELIRVGRDPGIGRITSEEMHAANARAVEARRDHSWVDLLASLGPRRQHLLDALETLGQDRFEAGAIPVGRWLPNFTCAHEEEHIAEIAAYLRQVDAV